MKKTQYKIKNAKQFLKSATSILDNLIPESLSKQNIPSLKAAAVQAQQAADELTYLAGMLDGVEQ